MANKLKVDERRAELAKRGLDTTGTKPSLFRRLESAMAQENKQSTDTVEASGGRKRDRDTQDGVSNGAEKIKATDKFQEMNIKQLREQAKFLGVSTTGTKKKLIERLCNGLPDNDSSLDTLQVKEEEAVNKKQKIVTATKKGAAVLDQYLSDQIKSEYHVFQLGDDVYDAMLNQTNVGNNNNNFYVIQLLESDDGGRFMVYNRWGRVGVRGQDKTFGPYTSRDTALYEFEQKFYAKTKNNWSERKEFKCHPKCYTWLEMDYSEKGKEPVVKEGFDSSSAMQPRETKLEQRIAKFISLICNVSMMRKQMMEIGYNADKLPLGKLSKSTILKGYEVLKRIANVIGTANKPQLEQLSGEFYTVIPHDFGFKKMRDFVIDTPQKLKHKLEMVEALGEIEVATKLLEDEPGMQFSTVKNRMLLWHGSRLTNWAGILSQGLRIAPPEAPVTGYMFGKGVYFADMFSKSANYCYATAAASAGVLLLCEVALGDMAEQLYANYDADKLPQGKLSTKGVGSTAPDLSCAKALEDGVTVPLGKAKQQEGHKGALLYNEYIVYNVDQIRMRYVVQVNFKYKNY
ncbi:poly [ADP-ribose] polymerase 2 isoform X4 [Jatropha curcas]|uniref:poly [ADP-ribose] polymerase 2 isoform X4 n=1 Tax=Jatropha curcas TaxID=180498 RepID=UPI0009D72411|nr:poly [ADP-ribose] polymerase 2 isoform X4 [Jatropha curcas]